MAERTKNTNIYFAILPLQNMSDDPKIDIFCIGLVMDIITDLSRFRSFQIISYDAIEHLQRNEKIDSPPLHELQLDYVVKGLIRTQREKLIFNLQLINIKQNRVVWAEKFGGPLEDLFLIQEEMVEKIVVSLQHFADHDLLIEVRKKPLTTLNAYECWIRGLQELKKGTIEADGQARVYFKNAMEIDPYYARAYTGMSLTYFNEWSCQIWDRWEVSQKGAFEWAQKALELDEWDHVSTAILGRIYLYNGEYDKAEHFLRKALRLNPNDADNLLVIAVGLVYLGYPQEAHELYDKARRLNPAGDDASFAFGAFVNFEMGNFDETIALSEKLPLGKGYVDFPAFLAAAYFQKGDLEKMEACWQEFLQEFSQKINRGKPADSQAALQWMININPFRGNTQLTPFWEYMSKGGINFTSKEKHLPYENCFMQESGLWTFSYAGKQAQMPELKGFYDIARLLSAPNQAIHCTELMGVQIIEKGEVVFDEKAKKAYQKRILDIQKELEEAEAAYHHERIAALQQEYDQLIDHLSKSIGIGGKTRKTSDSIEKARSAVTWRIRNAVKKITEVHPALGKHLEVSIKTGVFCEYTPEQEIHWLS